MITNAIFTERAGEVTSLEVTASDQDTVASRSTVENFVISIVDNDYLLLIVVDDDVAKTLLCLDALVAKLVEITSFQVRIFFAHYTVKYDSERILCGVYFVFKVNDLHLTTECSISSYVINNNIIAVLMEFHFRFKYSRTCVIRPPINRNSP